MSPELFSQSTRAERQQKPYSVVIPDTSRVDWANTISALTTQAHAKGDMLARTPEEILELFQKKHSMVLVDEKGNLLSHAGVTFEYPDGSIEVGAVCTNEGEEGNGFGKEVVAELLTHLKQLYPNRKIIALANTASEGLFKKVGGVKMSISELHRDVFNACKDCLRKPAEGEKFKCCDTPYNLTNFIQKKPVMETAIFSSPAHVNGKNGANHAKI